MWVETGSRFIGAGLVRFYRRQLRQGAMAMAMKPGINADKPPTTSCQLHRTCESYTKPPYSWTMAVAATIYHSRQRDDRYEL